MDFAHNLSRRVKAEQRIWQPKARVTPSPKTPYLLSFLIERDHPVPSHRLSL